MSQSKIGVISGWNSGMTRWDFVPGDHKIFIEVLLPTNGNLL